MTKRVHLITGGFPPGSPAGHDMNYARLNLLQKLQAEDHLAVTLESPAHALDEGITGDDHPDESVLTRLLGYKQVRNYDGSWTEWGNTVRSPIEKEC